MKCLVVLAAFILAIGAATDKDQWLQFKEKYGRDYRNLREENKRFAIFQNNLRTIEEHNEKYARGEKSYYLGITRFADLTPTEFTSMLTTSIPTENLKLKSFNAPATDAPSAIDWRDKGVVSEVKDQGDCESCWAFIATGALESAYAIKTGKNISLSEQNLIDCTIDYGNQGCNRGVTHSAFAYVMDNGIETETDYEYQGKDGTCEYDSSKSVLTISDYVPLTFDSESDLQQAVGTIGPVAVSIDASGFQLYTGGIYDDESCTWSVNHGVLVVGYDEEDGNEYWIAKNSWGPDWGENGFINMARNKDDQCGIALYAVYPEL